MQPRERVAARNSERNSIDIASTIPPRRDPKRQGSRRVSATNLSRSIHGLAQEYETTRGGFRARGLEYITPFCVSAWERLSDPMGRPEADDSGRVVYLHHGLRPHGALCREHAVGLPPRLRRDRVELPRGESAHGR